MKLALGLFLSLATVIACLAQQQEQQQQQPQSDSQGRPSTPLLGVRYSAATDVSHVSFNSPLVSYGSSLNEIQLPAAPIQPANLKQAAQGETQAAEGNPESQQGQTLVRNFAGQAPTQQLQASTAYNQPQFLSVQQYPANPQPQSTPQGFSLTQNLPGPQPQSAPQLSVAQPQIPQQQQQQFAFAQPQQPYVLPQQYVAPQQQQQQQQYVAQQQLPYQAQLAYASPGNNAYFATGPYAAQYPQTNLYASQFAPQPVTSQYAAAPDAQFVSRVAFNGPATSGFSYSF